jgi:hypothetical protein
MIALSAFMTIQSIPHSTSYSVALLTMCFNLQKNKELNQMKKLIFAGLFLSLSTLACAGAKESLIGKRLILDLPDTECAGLSFAKNGKDAAMYAEIGQCHDPLLLRVKWIDDKTFILIEKVRTNEISPPRSYLYTVQSINKHYLKLTQIWIGWGDLKDDTLGYYFK